MAKQILRTSGYSTIGEHITAHTELNRRYNLTSYVTDYGAVGDGLTDDTQSVQSAVTAVLSRGYGSLVFPDGIYKLTSTINFCVSKNLYYPVSIIGEGAVVLANMTDVPCFYFGGANCYSWRGMVLRGFYFDATSGTPSDIIRIERPSSSAAIYRFSLENITVENFSGNGIHINDCFEYQLLNCQLSANTNNTSGYCVFIEDDVSGNSSSINLINCNTRHGKNGLYSKNGVELSIFGGTFLMANEYGINLEWCSNVGVFHPHVENNWINGTPDVGHYQAGIFLTGLATITAPKFCLSNNQTIGIEIYPKWNTTITGFDAVVRDTDRFMVVQNNASGPNVVTVIGVPEQYIVNFSDGVNTKMVLL